MTLSTSEQRDTTSNTNIVHFKDDFYRDGFRVILLSLAMTVASIIFLIIISLYFFLHQVLPISFPVYNGWRVVPDVALDQRYLHTADLLQWISTALPEVFATDFVNYNQKLKEAAHYFTPNGWAKYAEAVNAFMNMNDVQKNKLFISASAGGAPIILNQGIIDGKYSRWVQMPLDVRYSGLERSARSASLTIQALVVRVSTLNNLDGVAIDNIIVTRS